MSQSRQTASLNNEEKKSAPVSFWQKLAIGSAAGTLEVAIDHPLQTLKARAQKGLPFTMDPSILYRGWGAYVASMAPTTALQIGGHYALTSAYKKYQNRELTVKENLGSAFVAGAISAVASCPTEAVILYQADTGAKFFSAVEHFKTSTKGLRGLYAGFGLTVMRDGPFGVFFLAVTPYLADRLYKPALQGWKLPYFNQETYAKVLGGSTAGIMAAVLTQAIDTVKSSVQRAHPDEPISTMTTVKKIADKDGVKGFFAGGSWRAARAASAISIMTLSGEVMSDWCKQKNNRQM